METKYLAPKASNFSMRIEVEGVDKKVKFENGVYSTDNEAEIKVLDNLLETNVNVRLHMKKVDIVAAEKVVADHQAAMARRVSKGSLHSGSLAMLKNEALKASGNALEEAAPNNPEALKELHKALESDANIAAGNNAMLLTETPTKVEEKTLSL